MPCTAIQSFPSKNIQTARFAHQLCKYSMRHEQFISEIGEATILYIKSELLARKIWIVIVTDMKRRIKNSCNSDGYLYLDEYLYTTAIIFMGTNMHMGYYTLMGRYSQEYDASLSMSNPSLPSTPPPPSPPHTHTHTHTHTRI